MITQFFYLGNVSRALKTKIYTFTQFYYGIVKKYQKPKEYKKNKNWMTFPWDCQRV